MTICSKALAAIAATLVLSSAGSAFAQDRKHGPDRASDRYERRAPPNPHADWRRGGHVPTEYRGPSYVVKDYRAYRLTAPKRGYHWIRVGGDYVLVAISTGIIAQIIVGR